MTCNKEIKINKTRKNQRYKTHEEGNRAQNTHPPPPPPPRVCVCVCVAAGITQQTIKQTQPKVRGDK